MTRTTGAGERLQKVLARAGVASRRAAETLIVAGRVRVDGRVVSELGVRVDRRAKVEVDGRRIVAESLVYLILHKPRGVVCTLSDPEGRPSLAEYLKDVGSRVVPVGRLDFHTSGALLCSNDGEFASRLAHPRYHAQKEYVAKVRGVLDDAALERFRERIEIDGKVTRPAEVRLLRVEGDKTWISVRLEEGRNRQVRRLGDHAGFPVLRLARVAHAGVTAEDLRPGQWRYLDADELAILQARYGVPRRVRPAPPPPPERSARSLAPGAARTRGRPTSKKPAREPTAYQPRGERGGRDAPVRGGRDAPVRGGRDAPVRGGRDAPVRGGRDAPVRGGRAAPVRGGRDAPVRGGRDAPVRGGRDAPVRGGRDAPARGAPSRGAPTRAAPARGAPVREAGDRAPYDRRKRPRTER